ncbi:MAG: hypothetical protein AABY32_02025 [Nanoarchaeota archaeon]
MGWYILANIQDTWDKFLFNKIIKPKFPTMNQNQYDQIKSFFIEKEIQFPNQNLSTIINKFINSFTIPKGDNQHIVDNLKINFNNYLNNLLSPEQKYEKLKNDITNQLVNANLPGYTKDDIDILADDIIKNNKNVNQVINNIKNEKNTGTKKLVEQLGEYKLYQLIEWESDSTDKHLEKKDQHPCHIDMKGTSWCARFKEYFDEYKKNNLFILFKNNKPYILIHENTNQIAGTDNKHISIDKLNDNELKIIGKVYNLINYAMQTKNTKIMNKILSLGYKHNDKSLNYALNSNNQEIIDKILSLGAKPDNDSLNYAIGTKNQEIIDKILNMGAKINKNSLDAAIQTENQEIIDKIFSLGAKPSDNSLSIAIQTRNTKIIDKILSLGVKPNEGALNSALYMRNMNIVNELLNLGIKPNSHSLDIVLQYKNIELIKKFINLGAKPDDHALYHAIGTENIEIIDKIFDLVGNKLYDGALNTAMLTRNMEVIDKIINLGAKPNERSLSSAMLTRNIKIIDKILSLGAKPDDDSLNYAIQTNNPEIIKLVENLIKKYASNGWYSNFIKSASNEIDPLTKEYLQHQEDENRLADLKRQRHITSPTFGNKKNIENEIRELEEKLKDFAPTPDDLYRATEYQQKITGATYIYFIKSGKLLFDHPKKSHENLIEKYYKNININDLYDNVAKQFHNDKNIDLDFEILTNNVPGVISGRVLNGVNTMWANPGPELNNLLNALNKNNIKVNKTYIPKQNKLFPTNELLHSF